MCKIMDAETIKALISTISAAVAIYGAILAHRSRTQTRKDIFEGHRDSLILVMAENDNRADYLAIQSALLNEKLSKLPSSIKAEKSEEYGIYQNQLVELSERAKVLELREYSQDDIESLAYDEETSLILRNMSRNEQLNSQSLNGDVTALIIKNIEKFIEENNT